MVDAERVREDWKARGFGCDEWVDPPGGPLAPSFDSTLSGS